MLGCSKDEPDQEEATQNIVFCSERTLLTGDAPRGFPLSYQKKRGGMGQGVVEAEVLTCNIQGTSVTWEKKTSFCFLVAAGDRGSR